MAKKETLCTGTGLCKTCSIVAVIVGILFLLQDLAIWDFWGISWYTVAFIMVGLYCLMSYK